MRKYRLLLAVLFLTALFLTSCDDSEEFYLTDEELTMEAEMGMPVDEYGDPSLDEPLDEEDCSGVFDCLLSGFDYVETAADCYEDEYFDEEDQLCYYDEESFDDECEAGEDCSETDLWSTLGELFGSGYGGGDPDTPIVTYTIKDDKLAEPELLSTDSEQFLAIQEDITKHQEIWYKFTSLFGPEERKEFVQFVIFTDGPEEVMASVHPLNDNLSTWVLSVDYQDAGDDKDLVYSLIHEYAHVMTLNHTQVDANQMPDSCTEYFPGEGCALSTSYIDAFHDQFWQPVFADLGIDDETYLGDDDMENYYYDNSDQFVTDYAATNPGEDIAESFTAFVLQPKPKGTTLADQKILFFYSYPELVQLRQKLASRTYSRLRRK